jgi:hypothetical protein
MVVTQIIDANDPARIIFLKVVHHRLALVCHISTTVFRKKFPRQFVKAINEDKDREETLV